MFTSETVISEAPHALFDVFILVPSICRGVNNWWENESLMCTDTILIDQSLNNRSMKKSTGKTLIKITSI